MSAPQFSSSDDPSSRYSFDDTSQRQSRRRTTGDETIGDQIIEEVDDALGCSNRLFGCSFWLFTLPFRLVWKGVRFVGSFFDD